MDPTFARQEELGPLRSRERLIVGSVLLLVLIVSILDAFEDWRLGQGPESFVVDGLYVIVMLGLLVYIWRVTPLTLTRSHRRLTREAVARHRDLEQWRERASTVVHGLGQLIEQQFEEWELTAAEREIGFLLLKGLSLKEIAAIRETTERTVRQQASSLYTKAGVSGRAELAAFFLEDLLPPS